MAQKKEDTLVAEIEKVLKRLLGCDTAPHEAQMEIIDRAIKLAELKKKNEAEGGFGSGFQ